MSGAKSLLKNPFVFGVVAGIFVVLFNISAASLAEGSFVEGYRVFLANGIFVYLIPLAVGIQMGLFRYHRNIISGHGVSGSEKMGLAGSATSSVTMIACCLHHVTGSLYIARAMMKDRAIIAEARDSTI